MPLAQPGAPRCHTCFAMAVWGDTLYIYGGLVSSATDVPVNVNTLMGFNLLTKTWELLHHKEKLSRSYPEGRHAHQMWALGGKLYIFGGMTPKGKWYPCMVAYRRRNEGMRACRFFEHCVLLYPIHPGLSLYHCQSLVLHQQAACIVHDPGRYFAMVFQQRYKICSATLIAACPPPGSRLPAPGS